MPLLQQIIDSRQFTELLAYKRRNTFAPDTWFAALQLARTIAHDPPEKFIPIRGDDDDEARQRRAAAAEQRLDRDAEET